MYLWVFLGRQSGWVAIPWLKLACFLGFQKVSFLQVSAGFSFVSAQFAVLGVIADSEYVDCMGNNRTSTLYGTLVDLDHDRWILLYQGQFLLLA